MGVGHVPELCCAVLDPTFSSTHAGGPSVLTQRESAADPGEKDPCAAKAVVACMFSQRFLSAWRNLFVLRSKVYRWSIHAVWTAAPRDRLA